MQAIAAEPFDAALLGEQVDRGRAAAGVDRAAHQRHRGGRVARRSSASISATAAISGTEGWQTPIVCTPGPR